MKKIRLVIMIVAFPFIAGACANGPVTTGSRENTDARTINALLKLKEGGAVTFAAIGGSITQGGCVDGVRDWLQTKARSSGGSVTYVNAGIGASDSGLGLLRVQDHVLRHNPDFVVIEYSVNDGYYYTGNEATYHRTYEGVVRQSLENSERAVFLLLLHRDDQGAAKSNPAHASQTAIGDTYALPVFKWMDYEKSVADWNNSNLYTDGTHPNAAGNISVSKGITDYLDKIWENLPDRPVQINTALPAPKFFDDYDKISLIKWGDAGVNNGGWTQYTTGLPDNWAALSSSLKDISGFMTDSQTDELEIKFKGKSVYIISTYTGSGVGKPGGGDRAGGRAWVVKADGSSTSQKIVCSGSYWSGPEWFGTQIADGLDPTKEHTLHIKGTSSGSINVWGAIVGVEP